MTFCQLWHLLVVTFSQLSLVTYVTHLSYSDHCNLWHFVFSDILSFVTFRLVTFCLLWHLSLVTFLWNLSVVTFGQLWPFVFSDILSFVTFRLVTFCLLWLVTFCLWSHLSSFINFDLSSLSLKFFNCHFCHYNSLKRIRFKVLFLILLNIFRD